MFSPASPTAVATAANYYGSSSTALTQCIAIGSTLQVSTTDGFNLVANWADPASSTSGVSGAMLYGGNLLMSCGSGNAKHLAVRSNSGATAFTGSAARLMLGTAFSFASLECSGDGKSTLRGPTTISVAADHGSATVTDSSSNPTSTTSFSAAQLDALFSPNGLVLDNGKTLRWVLYVVPAGALTKQVIVHTAVQSNGSTNVFSFVQP